MVIGIDTNLKQRLSGYSLHSARGDRRARSASGDEQRRLSSVPELRRSIPSLGRGLSACLLVGALIVTASWASAEGLQSPIHGCLDIKFGYFEPQIDEEFGSGEGPYAEIFGEGGTFYFELQYSHYLWRGFGALGIASALGYTSASGKSLLSDGTRSVEETELNLLPLRLSLSYRLDYFSRRHSFPFVPYLVAGLNYTLWWVRDASGVASYRNPESGELERGQGGTFGWQTNFGLQFLLDVLTPRMSRTFDAHTGVNNSFIFAEYAISRVDDFGSDSRMRLGSDSFLFGLAFEF